MPSLPCHRLRVRHERSSDALTLTGREHRDGTYLDRVTVRDEHHRADHAPVSLGHPHATIAEERLEVRVQRRRTLTDARDVRTERRLDTGFEGVQIGDLPLPDSHPRHCSSSLCTLTH